MFKPEFPLTNMSGQLTHFSIIRFTYSMLFLIVMCAKYYNAETQDWKRPQNTFFFSFAYTFLSVVSKTGQGTLAEA